MVFYNKLTLLFPVKATNHSYNNITNKIKGTWLSGKKLGKSY